MRTRYAKWRAGDKRALERDVIAQLGNPCYTPCPHDEVIPVVSVTGDVVAGLCLVCDRQLDRLHNRLHGLGAGRSN